MEAKKAAKPCPPGQVRNPATGRCIKEENLKKKAKQVAVDSADSVPVAVVATASPAANPEVQQYIDLFNQSEVRTLKPSVMPTKWMMPDRVGYVRWMQKTFKRKSGAAKATECGDIVDVNESCVYEAPDKLFPHQQFIRDYLQHASPYRGLLLYHGLGVGKSCASIGASEILINHRNVIVMLPASLRTNFIRELRFCGNWSYAPTQRWKFIPAAEMNSSLRRQIQYLSTDSIKQGLWVPIQGKKPNFHKLSSEQKTQVINQINQVIEARYKFLHYNGLTAKRVAELTADGNLFDNQVVIIDEVHNFISQVSNNGKIARKLYQLLMTAKNVKIVMLSGTPIINRPFEIAYIVNLLKGYEKVYEIEYSAKQGGVEAIEKQLAQHPRVNRFFVNPKTSRLQIQLTPPQFENAAAGTLVGVDVMSDEAALHDITRHLEDHKVKLDSKHKVIEFSSLPDDEEEFMNMFIDSDEQKVKNKDLFMRRILGAISYYESFDTSLYPSIRKNETVKVPLSEHQFKKYLEVRADERRREKNAKKKNNKMSEEKAASAFKAFSRAVCLFSFPEDVKRPYPSKMKMLLKEMDAMDDAAADDDNNEDENEAVVPAGIDIIREYQVLLNKALTSLNEDRETYLNRELATYAPKYAAFMKNLRACPGTALVYSQFRRVEGLGLLGMTLEAHGYVELKVRKNKGEWELDISQDDVHKKKYIKFTDDKEAVEVLLSVFNSDVDSKEHADKMPASIRDQLKALYGENATNLHGEIVQLMMITQSGAEGISLRNVRQVHVLEPYWNQIRIDQVIGRARRTRSHVALPEEERNIDVFKYVSVFTQKQLKDNFTLRKQDKSKTSDESIADVADRKSRLTNDLQDLMKRASVDCHVNREVHGVKCFEFPVNASGTEFATALSIVTEPLDNELVKKLETVSLKPKKVLIRNVPYLYNEATTELFSYDAYVNDGQIVLVGYMELMPDKANYIVKMKR